MLRFCNFGPRCRHKTHLNSSFIIGKFAKNHIISHFHYNLAVKQTESLGQVVHRCNQLMKLVPGWHDFSQLIPVLKQLLSGTAILIMYSAAGTTLFLSVLSVHWHVNGYIHRRDLNLQCQFNGHIFFCWVSLC